MFLEITGTNFQNKGAELMLAAIADQCSRRGRDLRCVVQPWNGSYLQRARLGLYQKAEYQRYKIRWHRSAALIPRQLRQQYGIVLEHEISAVLDASGFQFGDQWGSDICADAAERFERWARQGKKIILLPQAFGPFSDEALRASMARIIECAELVYARDPDSAAFLKDVAPQSQNIRTAPDFTNLLRVEAPREQGHVPLACILPNQRMLDSATEAVSSQYVKFLTDAVGALKERSYDVCFLVHEFKTDAGLIDTIAKETPHDFIVERLERAKDIKRFLGQCSVVVASRFHALAGALAQGVPSVGTGWSHKYKHLMGDYDCDSFFIDLERHDGAEQLKLLLEPEKLSEVKRRIVKRIKPLKDRALGMWSEVFDCLECQ